MIHNRIGIVLILLAACCFQPLAAADLTDKHWFIFLGRLHVVILHLPIGILGLAILAGLLRVLRIPLFEERGQLSLLFLGSLSALLAVILGLMFAQEERMSELKYWHMYTGIGVFAFSLTSLVFYRRVVQGKSGINNIAYILSLLLCGVSLVWSGHLGGSVTRGEHWLSKYAPWQANKSSAADRMDTQEPGQATEHTEADKESGVSAAQDVSESETGVGDSNKDDSQSAVVVDKEALNNEMSQDVNVNNDLAMSDGMSDGMTMNPVTVEPMNPSNEKAMADNAALFKRSVEPILAARCYECHGASKQKADLRLDSANFIRAGGKSGAVVIPGQPERSSLYTLVVLEEDDPDIMPPKGKALSKQQTDLIHKWILGGANFGDGDQGQAVQKKENVDKRVSLVEQQSQGLAKPDAAAIERLESAGITVEALSSNGALLELDLRFKEKPFIALRNDLLLLKEHILWLDVSRTEADDNFLKEVTKFLRLQRLILNNSQVTDQGLKHISSLKAIEVINLYGCQITDTGLKHLHKMRSLKKVYLWQTKVSKSGVRQLQKALPNLEISYGD